MLTNNPSVTHKTGVLWCWTRHADRERMHNNPSFKLVHKPIHASTRARATYFVAEEDDWESLFADTYAHWYKSMRVDFK